MVSDEIPDFLYRFTAITSFARVQEKPAKIIGADITTQHSLDAGAEALQWCGHAPIPP
jgi:hypothetical protein